MLRTILTTVAAVLTAIVAAGCGSSTSIRDSWRDPSATPASLMFKKIFVVGIMNDSAARRAAEDELVRLIEASPSHKTQAVASYTLFPDDVMKDEEKVKSEIANMGFDGAVLMRLADTTQETRWVPGTTAYPYGTFWGYYRWGWGFAYDPGYYRTDTKALVETMVHSVADDKLVWAGLSESFNPTNAAKLVGDVARAVGKELRKQGLISREE